MTHDQVEAMTMGHRVAVMRDGVLQQVDTPQQLYDAPKNLFVASFVGSPPMNLLEADVERDGTTLICRSGQTRIELPDDVVRKRARLERLVGKRIVLGIRPESVEDGGDGATIRGRVLLVEVLDAEQLVHLDIPALPLGRPELVDAARQPPGPVLVGGDEGRSTTLLGRFDRSSLLRPGEAAEVTVDPRQLHLFDLETGAALEAEDVPVTAELAS